MTESRPVVLVVDDTPANIELLHNILRDDYKIKVATDGEKGLELAARDPRPDIILLDIMMPGISGYEVINQLKENAKTSAIPVVFITAKSQVKDEQKGLALGAVDYVTKPFDPEIIKARVHTHVAAHLELRQLAEENRELRTRLDRAFSDFSEDSLLSLIQSGESDGLEFKSTLRWNLHADRSDKNIENECLKTVTMKSAFSFVWATQPRPSSPAKFSPISANISRVRPETLTRYRVILQFDAFPLFFAQQIIQILEHRFFIHRVIKDQFLRIFVELHWLQRFVYLGHLLGRRGGNLLHVLVRLLKDLFETYATKCCCP